MKWTPNSSQEKNRIFYDKIALTKGGAIFLLENIIIIDGEECISSGVRSVDGGYNVTAII